MGTKRNFRSVLAACLVAALLGGACGTKRSEEGERPQTHVVTDDLGRQLTLPVKVDRAVSLAPSLTEMIFAVGAGDRLVGDTAYCNYPPEAQVVAKVGDTQTPNIERIVALKPDVVFVSTASQLEAFMKTLESQNIAVYVSDPKDLDDILAGLGRLGELFGTTEHAASLAESLVGRIEEVREKAEDRKQVRVFLQISKEPLFTAGRDSFTTNIIAMAGGRSVTGDVPTAYPKLSKETALALAPEVIILSDSEDNREPNEVFASSPAVKNRRVYRIDPDIVSRPGPRLIDAAEKIESFLHDETAADSR